MGLMRALKYTAKGYLAGRVDMMTEESKRKREDAIREAEDEFQLNKQNDLLKGQLNNKISALEKAGELEADRVKKLKRMLLRD